MGDTKKDEDEQYEAIPQAEAVTPIKSQVMRALLWKNMLLKRKRWKSTCCECFLPASILLLLLYLKSLSSIDTFVTGWNQEPYDNFFNVKNSAFQFLNDAEERLSGEVSRFCLAHSGEQREIDALNRFIEFVDSDIFNEEFNGIPEDYFGFFPPTPGLEISFADFIHIEGGGTEAELQAYLTSADYGDPFDAVNPKCNGALIFTAIDFEKAQFDYTIQGDVDGFELFFMQVFATSSRFVNFEQQINEGILSRYMTEGFVNVQLMVDSFLINDALFNYTTLPLRVNPEDVAEDRLFFQPVNVAALAMPTGEFQLDEFFSALSGLLPLVYFMLFLIPVSQIIAVITLEKESRSREMMNLMGISDFKIIMSWFITYGGLFFGLSLLISILANGLFPSTAAEGFPFTIFFTFFLFGINVIVYGFLVSTLFWKSFNAVVMGLTVYIILFFLYYIYEQQEDIPNGILLIPQITFALTIETISLFESTGFGVAGEITSTKFIGFDVQTGILWLFFDIFFWSAIAFYLNAVFPRRYGATLPWNFLFWPDYWKAKYANITGADTAIGSQQEELTPVVGDNFEEPAENFKSQVGNKVGIQIRGMTKDFGTKRAVDNVDLDVFEGQILVLLGHNGAGKSTSLQMLTGSLNMTEGEAYIYGHRVRTGLGGIRGNLGFCPQHDLLYKELTVYEHLKFYGMVKGKYGDELKAEIEKSIAEVGLWDKKNTRSSKLSGGMKRKLSLAISLVGGSKVILVDEPTSGVDTYSRRSMWEVLQNARDGRVIILTTHFMDEADLLGDRIAIMSEGKMQCVGSTLFLKELYKTGYRLVFTVKEELDLEGQITELISEYIPNAIKSSDVGTELTYNLPLSEAAGFSNLFTELDNRIESGDLPISGYGIAVSTMEEVFLKAGRSADLIEGEAEYTDRNDDNAIQGIGEDVSFEGDSNLKIFFTQLQALLLKRLHYSKRDSYSCICGAIIPTVILFVGLAALTFGGFLDDEPPLLFEAEDLNPGLTNFISVLEFNEAGDVLEFEEGRFAQAALFQQFTLESAVDELTPANSGDQRTVFDRDYVNGDSVDGSALQEDAITKEAILDIGEQLFDELAEERIAARGGASLFASVLFRPEVSFVAESSRTQMSYKLMLNSTATHIVPIVISEVNSVLLRRSIAEYLDLTGLESEDTGSTVVFGEDETANGNPTLKFDFADEENAPRIRVTSLPLPIPADVQEGFDAFVGFTMSVFSVLAFGFVAAPIISYIVMEKEEAVQIKHLQFVSGTGLVVYWVSNYIFDIFAYMLPYGLALISIKYFDISFFVDDGAFPFVAVAFFGLGVALIPFTYLLGFLFKKSTTAITWMILLNCLGGLILLITSFTLDLLENTQDTNDKLKYIYRFFPMFSFGDSLLQIAIAGLLNRFGDDFYYYLDDEDLPQFSDKEVTGRNFLALFLVGPMYLFLVILVEYIQSRADLLKYFVWTRDPGTIDDNVDSDVADEAKRIIDKRTGASKKDDDAENSAEPDVLELISLRKVYGKKVAVKDVTIGIPAGECFGYLGVNGAGKTTTMKCLTGDTFPTSGSAFVNGYNAVADQWNVRKHIGYCSQFSSILGLLSVREHLQLFCRIKQIRNIDKTVELLMNRMSLSVFADTLSKNLSGGNKRKLSVAIAMIGSPTIMLLDEPSTGMDVASRKFMWNVISNMVNGAYTGKKTSVVLTTHSMEECEALCSRVGIMVDGGLKCLGSVQHLKTKFGKGFTLEIKLETVTKAEIQENWELLNEENRAINSVFMGQMTGFLEQLQLSEVSKKLNQENHAAAAFMHQLVSVGVDSRYFISFALLQQRIMALETFLNGSFQGVELVEAQDYRLTYRVDKNKDTRLSTIFQALEENKTVLKMSQYAVSQTTLEQIFNNFAKSQQAVLENN